VNQDSVKPEVNQEEKPNVMFKLDTSKNTFKGQRPQPKYSDDSEEEAFVKPKYTGMTFGAPVNKGFGQEPEKKKEPEPAASKVMFKVDASKNTFKG
jgi:hypothetical protein